tara:strand:+ start:3923 stop:4207 length:285 start_codon:yes stop_codon:yes gene_type:complete
MPLVARLGDTCTGHGCWPSRPNVSASPNVFADGIPVHRVGDAWGTHCCLALCHSSVLATGSPNVFANNIQVGRIGDAVACGSTVATGSATVWAN